MLWCESLVKCRFVSFEYGVPPAPHELMQLWAPVRVRFHVVSGVVWILRFIWTVD